MSSLIQLPLAYLLWHVTAAFGDLWRLYANMVWFLWNFFSIKILSFTLLSPWHRISEKRSKGSAGFFGQIIINSLTRIFGLIVRFFVILIGLFSLIIFSVLFLLLFVAWIALPVISIGLILYGVRGLFAAVLAL